MAVGGSYNPSTYKQSTPFETWAQVQGIGLYWDTENQFAAGKQGVRRASFSNPGAAYGQLRRAQAPGGNYLGGYGQRQLNFGGRDYGSQAIDRGEIGRLGSIMEPLAEGIAENPYVEKWREQQQAKRSYKTLQKSGVPLPPGAGVMPPPQPGPLPAPGQGPNIPPPPGPVPLPTPSRQPSPFYPPGQGPNVPPPPGSPSMTPPPPQPGAMPAPTVVGTPGVGLTGAQRMARAGQLQAQRNQARGTAPTTTPPQAVPSSTRTAPPTLPSPTSLVGDQTARLESEGVGQIAENVARSMQARTEARKASKSRKKS